MKRVLMASDVIRGLAGCTATAGSTDVPGPRTLVTIGRSHVCIPMLLHLIETYGKVQLYIILAPNQQEYEIVMDQVGERMRPRVVQCSHIELFATDPLNRMVTPLDLGPTNSCERLMETLKIELPKDALVTCPDMCCVYSQQTSLYTSCTCF